MLLSRALGPFQRRF